MFSIVYVMDANWLIFTMQPRFHVESLYKYRPGNRVEIIYRLAAAERLKSTKF